MPMVIWINGAFGSGKTSVANVLRSKMGNVHLFDPEEIGFFLWDNFPENMKRKGDFQNIPLWREFTYKMIKYISENYDGTVVIPMTLINEVYYNEIIGMLLRDGISVRHFILSASKETILYRLKQRGEDDDCWGAVHAERCIEALGHSIKGELIDTEKPFR